MTRVLVTALLCSLAVGVSGRQADKPQPRPPSSPGAPAWSRVIPMPDGRRLVSDGAMAIDARIAKPASTPTTSVSPTTGRVFEGHFNAPFTDEVALGSLARGPLENTFAGPRNILVNGNYVAFLRRAAPASRLRFRGPLDPVVIVSGGQPIGLVMPVASARKGS